VGGICKYIILYFYSSDNFWLLFFYLPKNILTLLLSVYVDGKSLGNRVIFGKIVNTLILKYHSFPGFWESFKAVKLFLT
jgi:hypothetical protein